jgi:hypothetical protein
MMSSPRRTALRLCLALCAAPAAAFAASAAPAAAPYFPPASGWAHKAPASLGMDPAKLAEAVRYAMSHETERARDFSDQEQTFGERLGSLPTQRAATNGVVIYKGYVVAEFGDTNYVDPTYSVAKSMLSTVAGVALRMGRIASLDEPVAKRVLDGGYASPHNAPITWTHHLQQESEWEGSMWGKNADFVGHAAFGAGERKPRTFQQPGNYLRYVDVIV